MKRPVVRRAWLMAFCGLGLGLLLTSCQQREPTVAKTTPERRTATVGGAEMVLVQGGSFVMGSGQGELDESPHRVSVGSFFMDRYEVTQEHYEQVMGENPSRWKGPQNPVEQIRWPNAIAYCNARSKLEGLEPAYDLATGECNFAAAGYRLPTEAEWEYAARAGSTTGYSFGDDPAELKRYAWFKSNSPLRRPSPVGQKEPNAWGLYDLYGNVCEWCHDRYGEEYYQHSPEQDPRGPPAGNTRVLRGGSWNSKSDECRSAYRLYEEPVYRDICFARDVHGLIGFRCVRRAAPSKEKVSGTVSRNS